LIGRSHRRIPPSLRATVDLPHRCTRRLSETRKDAENMTRPRQPRLHPAHLDEAQSRLYRAITEGPRSKGPQLFELTDEHGSLNGPFGGFLLSPAVGDALQALGAAVRYRTSLSDRTREMAILAVAARQESAFERYAHEAEGRACGLTAEELETLRAGGVPDLADHEERAALQLTMALLDGDVDESTWSTCVPPLPAGTVFELTTLVGYYSTLALQMRAFRVDHAPNETP
jgi:4-carboxymuconolactone decarboxylase